VTGRRTSGEEAVILAGLTRMIHCVAEPRIAANEVEDWTCWANRNFGAGVRRRHPPASDVRLQPSEDPAGFFVNVLQRGLRNVIKVAKAKAVLGDLLAEIDVVVVPERREVLDGGKRLARIDLHELSIVDEVAEEDPWKNRHAHATRGEVSESGHVVA
jgi:hypothetical protein